LQGRLYIWVNEAVLNEICRCLMRMHVRNKWGDRTFEVRKNACLLAI